MRSVGVREAASKLFFFIPILIGLMIGMYAHAEGEREVRESRARDASPQSSIQTENQSASVTAPVPPTVGNQPALPKASSQSVNAPSFGASPFSDHRVTLFSFGRGADSTSAATTTFITLDLRNGSLLGLGDIIGPFVKCVVLANRGWPLPDFASECKATTTPPSPPSLPPPLGTSTTTLTIRKFTGNFDDFFNFILSGANTGTTSIQTVGGSGGVSLLVNPGITTIAEGTKSGWALTGLMCAVNATTSGFLVGSSSWQILLPVGSAAICDFTNNFTGGQGGCSDPGCTPGGGNPGGGNPDSGTPGGGNPGGGSLGGGNGPIAGSFGAAMGDPGVPSVLGASTGSQPQIDGVGGAEPEMPSTGLGGWASTLLLTLFTSFSGMLISFSMLMRSLRRHAAFEAL